MSDARDRFRQRLASLPLGVKLAWLSAALIAVFVAATMIPLSISTRQTTRRIIATQLQQTQRALIENQRRELSRLEYAARLIGQNSTILAALVEDRGQSRGRGTKGRLNPQLIATVRGTLEEALPRIGQDLVAITDDSGRVFAAAMGHAQRAPLPSGTDLSSLPALRVALDPEAPADTGVYGVIDFANSAWSVAAVPLVAAGQTMGAILIGTRIDSTYVAPLRQTFNGDVVVTANDAVLASTRPGLALPRRPERREGDTLSFASLRTMEGQDLVAAPLSLGLNREGAPVTLWLLQPVAELSATVTRPLVAQFILYGLFAVVLSGLGAAAVAQTVLRPLGGFIQHVRSTSPAVERPRFGGRASSPEIRELDESFGTLIQSLAAERAQLERRTVELAAANTGLREEVAERERVENALRESEAQLRQSQKLEAIGTLAGGVAHDFNNLLTVITGYTQLALLHTPTGDPLRQDLKQVIEASDRAARLTHQLLAFSRKQVFLQSVIDLGAVVEGVEPMLKRLISEQIQMKVERETPLSRIIADRGQLEQVLINLVVNARDAMPKGGTLTIRTANETSDGQRVMLSVSDTGVGIPPDIRERIFEPFFTTKELGKGTGLGLSTVYGIVKQSGGTITIDSEVGKGTTFTVLLPRGGEQSAATVDDEEPMTMPRGSESILLVEDEPEVRALARRTLESLGYTVVTSADSEDAVRLAGESRFDVVLTDIVMPQLSGPQIVARIRTVYPQRSEGPVIIYMSGYADDALDQYELESDATFLRKPFSPAELARTIRGAIDRARTQAAV